MSTPSVVTLEIRDVLAGMLRNAEALKRLLLTYDDVGLDPEAQTHLHDLLDEIAARDVRHTQRIGALILNAHLDRRHGTGERRSGIERRQP